MVFILCICFSCNTNVRSDDFYTKAIEEGYKRYNAGRKNEVISFIDSIYRSGKNISPYALYQKYHFKKWYYFYQSVPDSNILYIDSMLYALEAFHIARDHPGEYAVALNAKGDYYYDHNDFDNAFEYYYRSKVAAEANKEYCALGNLTYHLGMVCYRQEKYKDAIPWFHAGFVQNHSCPDDSVAFYRNQELLNNIALCYTNLKEQDSALLYYNKALDYIGTEGKRFGSTVHMFCEVARGVIYGNLAKIYMASGRYDTAGQLLQSSIDINARPGYDNNDALYAKLQLAELYINIHDLSSASSVLQQIKQSVDALPNKNVEQRLLYLTHLYYMENQQPLLALEYMYSYLRLRDSLDAAGKKLKQTDIPLVLQSKDTQLQNLLLQKDQKVHRLVIAIIAVLVVMLVVVGSLVYVNYRRSKSNVRLLTVLNKRVKQQKKQLERAMEDLQRSNYEKDKVLHVVAHDLRDPIGGILVLAGMMLEKESDPTKKRYLELITNSTKTALTLISELLDAESEPLTGNREAVDLDELVTGVISILQPKANEKDQVLHYTASAGPVFVVAQREKLIRVISNLVTNAIKFSERASPIYITIEKNGGKARINVRDSGIGIPLHLQPFLFDSFSSARRKGTNGEQTFGLGLSICKQIVEANDGKIWFESGEHKGSTFSVELPLNTGARDN